MSFDDKNLKRQKFNDIEYIEWYKDDILGIYFTETPDIKCKEINRFIMDAEEIKAAKKKPLYLDNKIGVILNDKIKNKFYRFSIPKHYDYDGATIYKAFWRVVGSKEDVRFKVASLIHDVLCENHNYVDNDRYFADKVFERLLYVGGTCAFVRWLMFHSVDNFQKFCNWG